MGLDAKNRHGHVLKSCEIGFKRFALQVFRFLGGIRKAQGEFDPTMVKKVLFIGHHDKLGDMVISLPIFHNLKKFYPRIRIDVLGGKDNYDIVRTDPHITKAYSYKKKPLRDLINIIRMRREKYDCVVHLVFGASVTATILVALIAGRRFKFGVGKKNYAKYFDKTVEPERYKEHVIMGAGKALNLFGIDLKDCDMTPRLYLEDEDFEVGREFIGELKQKYGTVAAVNLSAGQARRVWPLEKYCALIEFLLEAYPEWVFVLTYAPSERWRADKALEKFGSRVVPIPTGMNIRQVAGIMKYLDFLITPDTSLTHLASAFDLPSLVMFDADDNHYAEWGPYNSKIRMLRSTHKTLLEPIMPKDMFDAFNEMVSEERAGKHEKAH
jgi:ADP-heptose:LPS heptosyltransferase